MQSIILVFLHALVRLFPLMCMGMEHRIMENPKSDSLIIKNQKLNLKCKEFWQELSLLSQVTNTTRHVYQRHLKRQHERNNSLSEYKFFWGVKRLHVIKTRRHFVCGLCLVL